MQQPVALLSAVKRGLSCRCPKCGRGRIFERYLKPAASCSVCGVTTGQIRTDDIAPYFTIMVVGHVVVPPLLLLEKMYAPPSWVHLAIWLPLAILATMVSLPRIKGAVTGWMWWLGIRGDEQH